MRDALLVRKLRNSRAWLPVSRLYQRSGLKAWVHGGALSKPVRTVSPQAALDLLGVTSKPFQPAPAFSPPVAAACGPMPAEDAVFFSRLVAALAPRRVFEFGTNWGVSTANIALNTPPEARISTLDVCREMFTAEHLAADLELQMVLSREHTGWHYRKVPELNAKVSQVFADSLTYEAAPGPVHDLILVDACHAYDFVKKDTLNALKTLVPGGCLLWHDFYPDVSSWADVYRWVSEFARTHEGVVHVEGTHFALWKAPSAAT